MKCRKCKKELQKRRRKWTTGLCRVCRLKVLPPAKGKKRPSVMRSSSKIKK